MQKSLTSERAKELYKEGNILIRLILNKCTEEERKFLFEWLRESEVNRNNLKYLRAKLILK